MTNNWKVCVALVAGLGCLAGSAVAQDRQLKYRRWDFEQAEVGTVPEGFQFYPHDPLNSAWRIALDGDDRGMRHDSPIRHEEIPALAVADDFKVKDVRLIAKMKIEGGEDEQSGAVIWRYKDAENFLMARIDVEDDKVRLFRVSDGNRVKFGEKGHLRLRRNASYNLRVDHRGDIIAVYLNFSIVLLETDRHFREPGQVGIWTITDSKLFIDDLEARELVDD